MPVDEDNMSIGALTGSKDERQALARKSIDFRCEACGCIRDIVRDKILDLTPENA